MNILQLITGHSAPSARLVRAWLIAWIGLSWMLIHLYAGFYGSPNAMLFRTLHLGVAMALVFLYLPTGGDRERQPWPLLLFDIVNVLACLWISVYFMIFYDTWEFRRGDMQLLDYGTGILCMYLTLETSRRAFGMSMVWVCLVFVFHALFSNYFPPPFNTAPASFERLIRTLFLGDEGIFGVAVSVMAQFVVLFILFGTLVTMTGGGAFFNRLAFALFGHRTGGPAKAAVVSSGLFGTISGSAISSVVTCGTFTIPLMKRLGYKPAFAGGVEAAAGNGGPLSPPVMGAVAFMMAEFLNVSYAAVCIAATIPAVLYYLVIFVTVHYEAKKLGLEGVDKSTLPSAWRIFLRQGYLLLPLVLIIVTLALGYSILFVSIIIIAASFAIALLQKAHRMTPYRLLASLEDTTRSVVGLCATAGAAGIIIGSVFATGLTFTVAQFTVDMAGNNMWLVLALVAFLSFVMGLGMPPTAIYITLVATVIPILVKAGISPMAAHLFAFYYGNAANITPPVALAAYVAAPLAGAGPNETGWQATRLGAGTFLLPFLFIYAPGLLFEGPLYMTVYVSLTAALGLSAFALAMTGYFFGPLPIWQRAAFFASAGLLIVPVAETNVPGFAVFLVAAVANWLEAKRNPATQAGPRPVASLDEARPTPPVRIAPTAIGRAWNRVLASRIEKDLVIPAPVSAAAGIENLHEALMREEETPGGPRDVTPRTLWLTWGGVVVAALALEYMGDTYFHARHPLLWVAAIGGVAAVSVAFVARVWAAGRVVPADARLPAHALPAGAIEG